MQCEKKYQNILKNSLGNVQMEIHKKAHTMPEVNVFCYFTHFLLVLWLDGRPSGWSSYINVKCIFSLNWIKRKIYSREIKRCHLNLKGMIMLDQRNMCLNFKYCKFVHDPILCYSTKSTKIGDSNPLKFLEEKWMIKASKNLKIKKS